MGLKRIVGLVVLLGLVSTLGIFMRNRATVPAKLRVCTWSNYFPESVVQEFTTETGIKVELSYVSSNEELFAKLKAGATGFDIVQPSDYMVRQMIALKMLTLLDNGSLPNSKHLDDYYRKLSYDPNNQYSIPFTWGTSGIAINTSKVKIPSDGVSWKMLLESEDPKRTSLLDDMREVFAANLLYKSLSPNTTDLTTLEKAQSEIDLTKNRVLMFTSEAKPLLLKEELNIAHIYSTDAVQASKENPAIQYFIPKEGALIWTDNFSIPVSSEHTKEAHAFINYFLAPENALKVIRANHLATPNKTAKSQLSTEEQNDPNVYPSPEVLSRLHFLEDIGDSLIQMNRMWTELKS